MAQMHPKHINDETVSNAERLLYSAFHEKLDDSYVVFHHAKWQGLDKEGRPRDGEADFIIAHPEYGVLVVEAKGGSIRYNARLDQWASISRDGDVHDIHDPFEQAMTSKYVLRDALQKMRGRQSRRVLLGHAVAFPEVVVPREWTSFDKPREIILDAASLAHLPRWFECVFSYWRGQSPAADPAAGRNAIDALLEILARSWELHPTLPTDFLREKD